MMQWIVLFKKELIENSRNFKWIWVPLVIILLAIMDPISTYYLPQIIESVGGLPDGATIELPTPLANEVIMMSLGQLSSLGVLIIVLMSMGTIAGERKSGVSELILVKPISYWNYITSKWVSLILLVWTSFILGMIASWYYINLLFGELLFSSLLQVILFYGLWLTLVVTISVFYNTLVKTPGLVGALTIITTTVMSLITNIFDHILTWSPINLSKHIHHLLMNNSVSTDIIATSIITVILIVLLLIVSVFSLRKRTLKD